MNWKRLQDIVPTRRDTLKLGALSMLGACAEQALWPVRVRAAVQSPGDGEDLHRN